MNELLKIILLFGAGFIAGFINVLAGGGSVLTLPVLIFFGLDGAMANGTNRIGILLQNLFAVKSFQKRKVHDFKQSFIMALCTLPGAVCGAVLAVKITDVWFQRILAAVMIGIAVSMFIPQKPTDINKKAGRNRGWYIYIALFFIGFYGGFIQVGVGFLLIAALYHLLKLSLVRVNMHKVFIIFIYSVPALLIFILSGKINWEYGLSIAAGTSFGAWWGAHFAVKGGEKIVRYILVIVIILMAVKLIGII